MSAEPSINYDPEADMLWIGLRRWPGEVAGSEPVGGEDAEPDLVIHYAADGVPWAWEIEHASKRADLVARALDAVRGLTVSKAA